MEVTRTEIYNPAHPSPPASVHGIEGIEERVSNLVVKYSKIVQVTAEIIAQKP